MSRFFIICLIVMTSHKTQGHTWEFLYQVDGIKVFSRSQKDAQCYKAEGIIHANLFELMAVIADLEKRPQWVRNLESSRAITGDISSTVLLYEKYNFPWPASDRDTVTKSITTVDYNNLEIEAEFYNSTHPDYPEQEGIIRIPEITGNQFFKFKSETTTFNRNSICIDIGGSLPGWLVRLVSQDMPVNTLKDLQDQVHRTNGQYDEFIKSHKKQAASRPNGSLR